MTIGENLGNGPDAFNVIEERLTALAVVDKGEVGPYFAKPPLVRDAASAHFLVEYGLGSCFKREGVSKCQAVYKEARGMQGAYGSVRAA